MNVLLRLIDMAQASDKVEKLVHRLLENLLTEIFCKDKNGQGNFDTLVDQMNIPGTSFQRLSICICLELLYLHAIQGHRNEHQPNQGFCTCDLFAVFPLVETYYTNTEENG